jgi:prepilin-type processing-associated H-X9-DG protein
MTVVAVLLLLLAMLFPGLRSAREQVRRMLCSNNLREWGRACWCYRNEFNDFIPLEGTYLQIENRYSWFNNLPPYLGAPSYSEVEKINGKIKEFPALHVWICPSKNLDPLYKSETGKNQFHYAMNQVLDGMDSELTPGSPDIPRKPIKAEPFADRPNTVFMFDNYKSQPGGKQEHVAKATRYHFRGANVLYLDGAVDGFKAEDFVVGGDYDRPVRIWTHPRLYWGYIPPQETSAGQ